MTKVMALCKNIFLTKKKTHSLFKKIKISHKVHFTHPFVATGTPLKATYLLNQAQLCLN